MVIMKESMHIAQITQSSWDSLQNDSFVEGFVSRQNLLFYHCAEAIHGNAKVYI